MATMADAGKVIEIRHPEVWSLAVRLSDSKLSYAVHSRFEDNSLEFGEILLDGNSGSYIKDVESAIYDNRFFLYNYETTDFLVDSNHFLLVPDEFSCNGDQGECERYYRYLFPDDGLGVRVDRIASQGISVVYGIRKEIDAFLRRTFDNPPVNHAITPIVKYACSRDSYYEQDARMYVYFSEGKMVAVALKGGKVVYANSFVFENADDAFYYVMAAWQASGMDSSADGLHMFGEKEMRSVLLAKLRKYVANVVQSIFPAQLLRLGRNAMQAPFDLIVLPICE